VGEEVAGEQSVEGTLLRHIFCFEESHPACGRNHPTCDRCGSSQSLYCVGYIYLGPRRGNAPSKVVVRTAFGRDLSGTVRGGEILWREFRGTSGMDPFGLHMGEMFPSIGDLREFLAELEQRKREEEELEKNPMFG